MTPGAFDRIARISSGGRGLLELEVERFGVRAEHRHADAGRRDHQIRMVQHLARLVQHLHLLLGVPVVEEDVDVGDQVERDPMGERGRCDRLAVEDLPGLHEQLVHGLGPCAAGGLVGRRDEAAELLRAVQRGDRHQHDDGRAVGVRDDALVRVDILGVHLGNHQRNVGLHAEGARVVDHQRARVDDALAELARDRRPGAEERQVDAAEGLVTQFLDGQLGALERHPLADRPGGGQELERLHGEAARFEDTEHLDAHRTGGASDCDGERPTHGTPFARTGVPF